MKMKCNSLILCLVGLMMAPTIQAQERAEHASQWMMAPSASTTRVNYQYDGEGLEYRIRWGMDTAWNDAGNVARGTNHIGKENISYGRVSFQPIDPVGEDLLLSSRQEDVLKSRCQNIRLSGTRQVLLNCDHEVLMADHYKKDGEWISGGEEQYNLVYETYRGANMAVNWYRVIKASILFCQTQGITVESVAVFNEPDYSSWNEGSQQDFKNIAKLIKEDPDLEGIRICAGNTLNTDPAMEWYNAVKPYVDEGNTHQLAGSFDNYANFFTTVRADGNIATADELHNTMEAFVAAEYGLQNGIWWGFDGVTRGRYCQATSGGRRLGYGESRSTWTAACVYRLPDGSVDAFLGGSERQANTNTFELACQDRDVFYDGYGPIRLFSQQVPGGRGYSNGQTNAETTIHITEGEDVADGPLEDGVYYIMNPRSKKVISAGGQAVKGSNIAVASYAGRADELWKVAAVAPKVGGDFCYHYLKPNGNDELYVNLLNYSTNAGDGMILYDGGGGSNEQWHFIYAGDGNYYIQSRYSGLFLAMANASATKVTQQTFKANNRYMLWRLVPADAVVTTIETKAPAAPVGLTATPQAASVRLSWDANTETDLASYIILRGEATSETGDNWQTVGHGVLSTEFVDNTCQAGTAYLYKIKAVDKMGNRSNDSELVAAQTNGESMLIAHYGFDQTLQDDTENQFDAVADGSLNYQTSEDMHKEGTAALTLNTSTRNKHYLLLPHEVGNLSEMTVALWVYWRGGSAWQRIFDFGNSTDQYIFLTPSNGSGRLSLGIKNGGDEQTLTCSSELQSGDWHHVAVTLSDTEVKIYVDGVEQASTENITIRPSDFRPGFNFIGRSQFSSDPHLLGYVDDLSIWNYALTATDVAAVMQGQPTAIENLSAPTASPIVATEYYSVNGQRIAQPTRGMLIMKQRHADGSTTVRKEIR